jgi:hypothetical protein
VDTLSSIPRYRQRSPLFYRRVAIAPLCLCLVAGMHLYRVVAAGQTPWKGGGFGMFSTVDAETSRYLRCYLVTAHGEVPLAIPPQLSRRAIELRAAPSLSCAEELARRLAASRWERVANRDAHLAERVRHLAPNEPLSVAVLQQAGREAGEASSALPMGGMVAAQAIPTAVPDVGGIPFSAVRVEVWRFRFDENGPRLTGKPMLVAVQPRLLGVEEAQ